MKKTLAVVLVSFVVVVQAFAQNPYPGNALPTSPWLHDGSGTQTIVPIDTGNGLQLVDSGGSSIYNQYYAEHTMPVITMESRFRIDSTNGSPSILQLSTPGAASPKAPTLAVAITGGHFFFKSLDGGKTYLDIGLIDSNFHVAQLGIDKTTSKVYASWDGVMMLNGVDASTYLDSSFNPAYVEFGAGTFGHGVGNTTATFDYVNYNSGITVTPEPTTLGLLLLGSLAIRRSRRTA